jgi:hypothetical protein
MEPNPYEAPRTGKGIPAEGRTQGLFAAGLAAMLCSLLLSTVTLTGHHREALVIAILLTVVADACLAAVVGRGSPGMRWLALAAMGPTLFVLIDFVRRAPYVF